VFTKKSVLLPFEYGAVVTDRNGFDEFPSDHGILNGHLHSSLKSAF
jgi:hypothetical protein